jgi:hypothetical protein
MVLSPLNILPTFDTLPNRVAYLKALLDFTSDDVAALRSLAANPVMATLLPAVLDTVYMKLFSDVETLVSTPRDKEGTMKGPRAPTVNHSQKESLKTYFFKLATADYNANETWEHLDRVVVAYTESTKSELGSTYNSVPGFLGATQ